MLTFACKNIASAANFNLFMTIQDAFILIINTVEPLSDTREATNIAHMVLEDITGLSRMDRVFKKDNDLSDEEEQRVKRTVKALAQHEPVQYVIGKAYFHAFELAVDKNVLIPRPETEELVGWIVSEAASAVRILDIGTGSGAIPLALKYELPGADVWSVDVSEGALGVARANATALHLDIHLSQIDILDTTASKKLPVFDIIVSNPPYIRDSEEVNMDANVTAHEPRIALFVPDNDPLVFYRSIGLLAKENLTPGGRLYFEINEAFGKEVVALLEEQGFVNVELRQDIYERDRMVRADKSV